MMKFKIQEDSFPLCQPFTISRGTVDRVDVVSVRAQRDGVIGRGECRPYGRYGETVDSVRAQIAGAVKALEHGADESDLGQLLEPGAARNAVDCALWDWRAKHTGIPAWELAGLPKPLPCPVTYTISLGPPAKMAEDARKADRPLLKLKLGTADDVRRVRAVRDAAPQSRLIADANEGWSREMLETMAPALADLGVEMIEQPLPADEDHCLAGYASPVPLCADESCHSDKDAAQLADRYAMVNIKLDKTGGLTGAIELAREAERHGLAIMVGCMMASSLAMAPAFLLAPFARYVDLDAPILLARDRDHAIRFDGAVMQPPSADLWG